MSLNLEKQLRFYGAYHHDSVNIGIHMICVLPILLTFILLFTNTPTLIPPSTYTTNPFLQLLPTNLALPLCLAYCTLYVLLEPVAGTTLALVLLCATAYANHLTAHHNPTVSYYAAGVNAVSWIAQFVGHGVFEGRAPALLDNLYQAVFLAPLFVWLEFLFALGYRSDLKTRLNALAEEDVRKFRESKKANGHAKSG